MFDGPKRFFNSRQCIWWNRVGRTVTHIVVFILLAKFLLYFFIDPTLQVGSSTLDKITADYRVYFWTVVLALTLLAYLTLIIGAISYYSHARSVGESKLIWRQIQTAASLLTLYVIIFSIYLPCAGLFEAEFITAAVVWITASIAILGWVISYQITSIRDQEARKHTETTQRKNHTLNVLLQSRISDTFQNKLEKVNLVYPRGIEIPDVMNDIKLKLMIEHPGFIANIGKVKFPDGQEITVTDDELNQAKAIEAIIYILNYYEFLSVGVVKDDIDEKLLFECLSGIFTSLHQRAKYLMEHSISVAGSGVFEHFRAISEAWSQGKSLKTGEDIR